MTSVREATSHRSGCREADDWKTSTSVDPQFALVARQHRRVFAVFNELGIHSRDAHKALAQSGWRVKCLNGMDDIVASAREMFWSRQWWPPNVARPSICEPSM